MSRSSTWSTPARRPEAPARSSLRNLHTAGARQDVCPPCACCVFCGDRFFACQRASPDLPGFSAFSVFSVFPVSAVSAVSAVEDSVEKCAQRRFVAENRPQLPEAPGVVRFGNPEAQITALVVLLLQVLAAAGVVPLAIQRGVVRQSVLHRAADDRPGFDYPVGFGDDASVDCPRRAVRRGAVVFHRLAHRGDLLLREPSAQRGVPGKDPPSVEVVAFASVGEPRVVVGRDCIDHLRVDVAARCQGEALRNDRAHVVRAVRGVEVFVAREDLPLDILFQFGIHDGKGMKKSLRKSPEGFF